MTEQFRQGDILFERVDQVAQGFYQENEDKVIAYGEISNHKHILSGNAMLFVRPHQQRGVHEDDNRIGYIVAHEDAKVVHDEHAVMPLKKGTYVVSQQREFVHENQSDFKRYVQPKVKRVQD